MLRYDIYIYIYIYMSLGFKRLISSLPLETRGSIVGYRDGGIGRMIRDSNPSRGKKCITYPKRKTGFGAHLAS